MSASSSGHRLPLFGTPWNRPGLRWTDGQISRRRRRPDQSADKIRPTPRVASGVERGRVRPVHPLLAAARRAVHGVEGWVLSLEMLDHPERWTTRGQPSETPVEKPLTPTPPRTKRKVDLQPAAMAAT